MSSNSGFFLDEDGEDSDWIEIYNAEPMPVSLLGFSLSDRSDQLAQWSFPDTVVQPASFLIVFASGKNRAISGQELHTNFSISADGEELFLSNSGAIIHETAAYTLDINQSVGLAENGNGPFVIFSSPTPGISNTSTYIAQEDIEFSHPGGGYAHAFDIELTGNVPETLIRYTLDGDVPTAGSSVYASPLHINEELLSDAKLFANNISPPKGGFYYPVKVRRIIVIRAALFDGNGNMVSRVFTNSYFLSGMDAIDENLAVVSIAVNEDDLLNYEQGIFARGIHWNANNPDWSGNYFKRGNDWEREINFEFYQGNSQKINVRTGMRVHGGYSRRYTQKGMRIYARSEYGQSKLNEAFFESKSIGHFKRLVLKPFMSSWTDSGLEDHLCNILVSGTKVDHVASKPVALYLNGEYWGVYYLQERVDKHYLQGNFGVDEVDIIEGWDAMATTGNNQNFLALYDFFEDHDLSLETNYATIKNWIDIDNFIDYQLFEIFIANYDWPANNMKCWREQSSDSKWRWIFFDGDAAFGSVLFDGVSHALDELHNAWPTNAHSTLFLRRLWDNADFRTRFLSRFIELSESVFEPENTQNILRDIKEQVSDGVPRMIERHAIPECAQHWRVLADSIDQFLAHRTCQMQTHLNNVLDQKFYVPSCYDHVSEAFTQPLLYPNPNRGAFHLRLFIEEYGIVQVEAYSILGELLYTENFTLAEGVNEIAIQYPGNHEGMSLVKVTANSKQWLVKNLSSSQAE